MNFPSVVFLRSIYFLCKTLWFIQWQRKYTIILYNLTWYQSSRFYLDIVVTRLVRPLPPSMTRHSHRRGQTQVTQVWTLPPHISLDTVPKKLLISLVVCLLQICHCVWRQLCRISLTTSAVARPMSDDQFRLVSDVFPNLFCLILGVHEDSLWFRYVLARFVSAFLTKYCS